MQETKLCLTPLLPAIPSNRGTLQREFYHRPRGRPSSTGNLKGTHFKSDFGNPGMAAPSYHQSLSGEEIASFLRKMNDLPYLWALLRLEGHLGDAPLRLHPK